MKSVANKKVLLISILTLVIVVLTLAGVTFAYFITDGFASAKNVTVSYDGQAVIEINNERELRKWSKDGSYNNPSEVSEGASRVILKLVNNIALSSDLLIDRDVHLDLNGKDLTIGTYKITVKHTYIANVKIYNGTININGIDGVTENKWIILDIPKAQFVFGNNVTINKDGTTIAGEDEKYSIIKVISSKTNEELANEIAEYAKLSIDDIYISDIPLFYNYMAYDYIDISWISDNSDIVNNNGVIVNNTDDTLSRKTNLAIVLTFNNSNKETITLPIKEITVPTSGDMQSRVSEIKKLLDEYFFRYKTGDEYILAGDMYLPSENNYYGLDIKYDFLLDGASVNAILTDADNGEVYIKKPDTIGKYTLSVSLTDKSDASKSGELIYIFAVTATDNNDNAEDIVDIINNGAALIFETGEEVLSLLSKEDWENFNAVSIEYSIIDRNGDEIRDIDGTYKYYNISIPTNVTDKVNLSMKEEKPDYTEQIYLKLNIEFKSGKPIEITQTIQIYYVNSNTGGGSGDGDDVNAFYYYLITDEINRLTNNGITYVSFVMANNWLGKKQVKYELNLPSDLNSEAIEIVRNADGTSTFRIDKQKIGAENTGFYIRFKFAEFGADIQDWSTIPYYGETIDADGNVTGNPKELYITLEGIIGGRNAEGLINGLPIRDANLFDKLYGIYNVSDLDSEQVLTRNEMMGSNTHLTFIASDAITDYCGIQYLDNLSTVHFYNGIKVDDLPYVSALSSLKELLIHNSTLTSSDLNGANGINVLKNLEKLDLSNNDFGDGFILTYRFNALKELILDNCKLKDLKFAVNLPSLTILRVNNNDIKEFNEINKFVSNYFKEIYISDNFNTESGIQYYGSEGIYNTSLFTMLCINGLQLYNVYDDASDEYIIFNYELYLEGASVLESITLTNSISGGIVVPKYLVSDKGLTYNLSWINGITNEIITYNGEDSQFEITGVDKLIVKVTAGGQDVYRIIYMER